MSNRWIYDKVNRLIKKHRTRDPSELIPAMNIKLEYLHDAKHLLGMYTVIQRNRFIFISDNVGKNKNTILAHELGHDQLHRDHCKDGAFFQENKLFNPTNKLETQANIFAAHLLIFIIISSSITSTIKPENAINQTRKAITKLDFKAMSYVKKISYLSSMNTMKPIKENIRPKGNPGTNMTKIGKGSLGRENFNLTLIE